MIVNTIDKLLEDYKAVRLSRDALSVGVISTLLGDIENVTKKRLAEKEDATDAEVEASIKRMLKGINFIIDQPGVLESALHVAMRERDILKQYLPKELSDEVMVGTLERANFESLGACMKYFQAVFPGQYDSKKLRAMYERK